MELTQTQIDEVRKRAMSNMSMFATCPICKKTMLVLSTEQSKAGMPEAYCESCHLSIPLKG